MLCLWKASMKFLPLLALLLSACAPVIHPLEPSQTPTPTKVIPTKTPALSLVRNDTLAKVTVSQSLNVRQSPGKTARVIGYLYRGNQVVMTGKCSRDPKGWAEIKWKNGTAWINARFLSDNLCKEN